MAIDLSRGTPSAHLLERWPRQDAGIAHFCVILSRGCRSEESRLCFRAVTVENEFLFERLVPRESKDLREAMLPELPRPRLLRERQPKRTRGGEGAGLRGISTRAEDLHPHPRVTAFAEKKQTSRRTASPAKKRARLFTPIASRRDSTRNGDSCSFRSERQTRNRDSSLRQPPLRMTRPSSYLFLIGPVRRSLP